jgi:hypothetical protein
VVESWEICIALPFVGIDSEHWVGLGGNLGGFGLKETRLFVSTSTETQETFMVGQILATNFVPLAIYFTLHICVLRVLEL